MTLVRSGLGATILPRCVLSGRQDDGSLRFLRLRNAYLRRDVGVCALERWAACSAGRYGRRPLRAAFPRWPLCAESRGHLILMKTVPVICLRANKILGLLSLRLRSAVPTRESAACRKRAKPLRSSLSTRFPPVHSCAYTKLRTLSFKRPPYNRMRPDLARLTSVGPPAKTLPRRRSSPKSAMLEYRSARGNRVERLLQRAFASFRRCRALARRDGPGANRRERRGRPACLAGTVLILRQRGRR
jgi:hypothetical protein